MIFCHKYKEIEGSIPYTNESFQKKCLTDNLVKDMIERKLGRIINFNENNEVPDEIQPTRGGKKNWFRIHNWTINLLPDQVFLSPK